MTSVRGRLLLWLLPALAATLLIAAAFSFVRAREGVGEIFDYHLRQIATSLEDQSILSIALDDSALRLNEDRILLQIWDRARGLVLITQRGSELPLLTETGFHNISLGGARYRVYSLVLGDRVIEVAQREQARNELSAEIAARTVLPFALALPAVIVVALLAVNEGLLPINRLAREVASRSARSLDPLPTSGLPREIAPLASGLNDLLARLGQTLESQRAFIADAAHELRSPITALSLQLQLLERMDDPAARREAIEQFRLGIERARRLVEQLLTLARLEPEAPVATAGADLLRIAREVVAEHSTEAEEKGVDLGVARAESAEVVGDAVALRMLINNLVDNAVRYTPAGGHVDVSIWAGGGEARIEVADDGPGIPPDMRERAFDRFFRGETSGKSGTGLGLAIARRVVERHGGRIELGEGLGGRGLTVRVWMPLRQVSFGPPAEPQR